MEIRVKLMMLQCALLHGLLLYSDAAGFVTFSTGQITQWEPALINTLRNHLHNCTVLHNGMLTFPTDWLYDFLSLPTIWCHWVMFYFYSCFAALRFLFHWSSQQLNVFVVSKCNCCTWCRPSSVFSHFYLW